MAIKDWVRRRFRRMRPFERRWIRDPDERDEHLRRTTERLAPAHGTPDPAAAPEPETPQP